MTDVHEDGGVSQSRAGQFHVLRKRWAVIDDIVFHSTILLQRCFGRSPNTEAQTDPVDEITKASQKDAARRTHRSNKTKITNVDSSISVTSTTLADIAALATLVRTSLSTSNLSRMFLR